MNKPRGVEPAAKLLNARMPYLFNAKLMADEMMDQLPRQTVDLASEEMRTRVRDWLRGELMRACRAMEHTFSQASERAFVAAREIATDEAYYQKRRRRTLKERQRERKERERWKAEQAAMEEAKRSSFREAVQSGKLKPIRGGFRLDLVNETRTGDKPEVPA